MAFNLFIKKFVAYIPTTLWSVFVLVASLLPAKQIAQFNIQDKIAHLGVYAILGALLIWSNQKTFERFFKKYSFVFAVLFGAIIEILQGTCTPDRCFDGFDILANSVGAMLGILCAPFILSFNKK